MMKNQHETIIRVEDKCKKIAQLIGEAKNKNSTQKVQAMVITDDHKNQLEVHVKELEDQRQKEERKYKQQINKIDS